jgi:23S rRNA pseudouridine2605 synthase
VTQERLQKFLSSAGVAARRKAEEMITAGRVTVNGKVVRVLGTKVDPEHDSVLVDGEAVAAKDTFYVLLNKPKGCITAVTDDRGRPTVMDYLPNLPVGVRPVGRLDFYSEGVLLLTNDGELAAKLLAPASHVPKTYHVKIHGELSDDQLKLLRKGVRLEDGTMTLPAEINVLPAESKHMWLAITLREGKNRQIHRMIEALGFRIDKLQRVAFANLTFHGLRVGDARELTQQELNELLDAAGLPHGPAARGRWRAKRELTDIPRRARQKVRDEAELAAAASAPAAARPAPHADTRDDRGGPRGGARDDRGGPRGGARDDRGGPRGGGRDDRRPASGGGPRDGRPPARGAGRPSRDERPAQRDDARRSFGKRTRKTETRRR